MVHAHDLEVGLALLDPSDALELRVDHERPTRAARHDGAVLAGDTVGRETFVCPSSEIRILYTGMFMLIVRVFLWQNRETSLVPNPPDALGLRVEHDCRE